MKIRARRVQQVVVVELTVSGEFFNECERTLRPFDHGDSDGPIQRDDR